MYFFKYILDHKEEEEDLFHDVSQEVNNSIQSSYWETLSADYFFRWLDYYESFSFLWATSVVLQELNFEILEQIISTKKQTCSKCGCFFGLIIYLFLNLKIDYLILFLFNKCTSECFHNVFSMGFFYSYFSIIQQLFPST